jgi:hypothetical protein
MHGLKIFSLRSHWQGTPGQVSSRAQHVTRMLIVKNIIKKSLL